MSLVSFSRYKARLTKSARPLWPIALARQEAVQSSMRVTKNIKICSGEPIVN